MTGNQYHYTPSKFEKLRQEAEELILNKPELGSSPPSDILELISELKIHQTELEIQNEELKQTRNEISKMHREFENLYEFAPCGYLTLNTKGIITRANLTGVKLLGISRKFLYGSGFSRYIAEDWNGEYMKTRNKCLETNEKQSIELPLKTKGKSPLWVRADIEADQDETGAVIQWRMVLLDISLQRQAEEDRKILEDQLRQAQKMEAIGNLAGGIAHDFNNILSSVMGFAELSLEEVEQGSNLEDNLQEIFTAGKRAKDLVSEIMTFSRQTNEQVEPVYIGTIVKESNHLLRLSLPSNIIIKQKLKSYEMVMGNYALLQQVLLNLVNNAADAMGDKGGTIDVSVSDITADESFTRKYGLADPGNYVKITVADTGEGIPSETIKSIFEPYFTTKETGKGTGLGLATVQGTVKKYGGTITVESNPGKGTLFTVLLPATKKHEHIKSNESENLPHGSERILFVDDEISIVKINHQILAGLGYNVTARTSSIEALEIFESNPNDFDLVITDMTMPNLTGDKLATELMKIRPDIPVIICTGYSKKVSPEKASELGIRAFVYKPLERAYLAKTIRKVLDADKS